MRKRVVPATEQGQAQYAGLVPHPAKQPDPAAQPDAESRSPDEARVAQVKVWPLGISPMVWRRVLVAEPSRPSTMGPARRKTSLYQRP